MSTGVKNEQIIKISLDDIQNLKYRNPIELDKYLRDHIEDSNLQYYIFIDEIQFVKEIKNPFFEEDDSKITFVDVLIGLMKIQNLDIYVTGSNSKKLSKDVLTQFRDRGDEIKVYPFSFSEFYSCYEGEKSNAFSDYCIYGGMPRSVVELKSHNQKSEYLKGIFETTYLKDFIERYSISNDKVVISSLLDIISSYIGSLTNPSKLEKTFKSEKNITISRHLISNYISYFEEAFLIEKAQRYDVKGKKYISTPYKYYFSDLGLRNARLNFRQNEITHIMENVIYNELRMRGYNVDVGVVEYNTKFKWEIS